MSASAIGALRHRLVLEPPRDEADGFGGFVRTYVAGPMLWGEIAPVRAADRFVAGRDEWTLTHRVTMRRRDDVKPGVRLRFGARIFLVHAARETDARGDRLVCHCEEIAS
jgi:SPP1 family predicted phage head-tail adaptor